MGLSCSLCKGACCEEMLLPRGPADDDASRWFALHGTPVIREGTPFLRFELRCTMLSPGGTCSVYEQRPEVCRTFELGGPECRDAVARRRPGLLKRVDGEEK